MPAMQYNLRSLMIVAMLGFLLLAGCRESKIIRHGIQDVDKHAKDIEKANQPIGKDRPTHEMLHP